MSHGQAELLPHDNTECVRSGPTGLPTSQPSCTTPARAPSRAFGCWPVHRYAQCLSRLREELLSACGSNSSCSKGRICCFVLLRPGSCPMWDKALSTEDVALGPRGKVRSPGKVHSGPGHSKARPGSSHDAFDYFMAEARTVRSKLSSNVAVYRAKHRPPPPLEASRHSICDHRTTCFSTRAKGRACEDVRIG